MFSESDRGVKWVECQICHRKMKSLGKHLSSSHAMSAQDYRSQFPDALIKCTETRERYSQQNKSNADWINRRKDAGIDLTAYKAKMGAAVSSSIMNNEHERKRRAEQMAANNRTESARERSRNTALKTSQRPEILAARSAQLERWRTEHPEEFYEKCTAVMHATMSSKPEKQLFEIVKLIEPTFKRSQRLHDPIFSSVSQRKQIDIMSHELGVLIEFDGRIHFDPIHGDDTLADVKQRDIELDRVVEKQELTLVRISFDQYRYGANRGFKKEAIEQLTEIIKNPTPGVFKIGDSYKSHRSPVSATDTTDVLM